MRDLIERAALRTALTDASRTEHQKDTHQSRMIAYGLDLACTAVDYAPSVDAVQVVHCGDCKYGSEDGSYEYSGQSDTHVNCRRLLTSRHGVLIMPKNGYCSKGERREDKHG